MALILWETVCLLKEHRSLGVFVSAKNCFRLQSTPHWPALGHTATPKVQNRLQSIVQDMLRELFEPTTQSLLHPINLKQILYMFQENLNYL